MRRVGSRYWGVANFDRPRGSRESSKSAMPITVSGSAVAATHPGLLTPVVASWRAAGGPLADDSPEPPELGSASHWAKRIVSAVKGKIAPGAYGVPVPPASVFQPTNLNPLRTKEFADNAVDVAAD